MASAILISGMKPTGASWWESLLTSVSAVVYLLYASVSIYREQTGNESWCKSLMDQSGLKQCFEHVTLLHASKIQQNEAVQYKIYLFFAIKEGRNSQQFSCIHCGLSCEGTPLLTQMTYSQFLYSGIRRKRNGSPQNGSDLFSSKTKTLCCFLKLTGGRSCMWLLLSQSRKSTDLSVQRG